MSNSYNRWSKLAGLPQESEGLLSESVDHQNDETEVRNIVREQIQTMLSEGLLTEAKASREQGKAIQRVLSNIMSRNPEFKPLDIDGVYGPKTRDAVVAFQKSLGLTPDGIVGRGTLGKMFDIMQDKISAPGNPMADADMDLVAALPDPNEGIVFGYKLADSPSRAPAPEPAEEEKMSNDKFVDFMKDLGMPLNTAQLKRLEGDGPEAVVGDLAPGARQKVGQGLEVLQKKELDLDMTSIGPESPYDIVNLDEDIYEDIFEEA